MSQDIDIEKLAKLSRLELSEEEKAQAKGRLQRLLGLMDSLKGLNLSGAPDVSSAASDLREDSPEASLPIEQVFLNAPKEENRCFAIPKVM